MSTPPNSDETSPVPVLPHGPRRGEYFEVDITSIDSDGHGVGHTRAMVGPQRAPKSWRWSLRGCVPGDRVSLDAGGAHGTHAWGRVSALLTASADRIAAPCSHYASDPGNHRGCGGCTMQSLPRALQHHHKREQIERCFRQHRSLREVVVLPVVADVDAWRYRNKMEFSFGTDRSGAFALGLHPGGFRHEVFSLRDCHLISAEGSAVVRETAAILATLGMQPWHERTGAGWLRTFTIREGRRTGERLIELTTADVESVVTSSGMQTPEEAAALFTQAVHSAAQALGAGHEVTSLWWTRHRARRGERTTLVETHLSGRVSMAEELHLPGGIALRFEIHPRAFFQPNTLQAESLYALAIGAALRGFARGVRLLDLYCGTGTIGLCAAAMGAHVVGIELVPSAVDNARANAALNGITDARFLAGDVATTLRAEGLDAPGAADVVLVDPPRAGLSADALDCVLQIAAARIVYVSCNPETLARDAAKLVELGYTIGAVQPVDMFPHTAHIENVAVFDRIGV